MKNSKNNSIIGVFKEIINMIILFFKPFGLKDKMLEIPDNVKKMGLKIELRRFITTLVALFFSFMLKFVNISIENRMILLGIILFMLYKGERIVFQAIDIYEESERNKFDLIYDDEMVLRASKLIGKTTDRVLKYDEKTNVYRTINNESMLNSIKKYLSKLWDLRIRHFFEIMELFSIALMIIIAILTNNTIPQGAFIALMIVSVCISFFSSAYINITRINYYNKNREFDNMQSIIVNDLLRVPTIVKQDLDMRINKFKKSVVDSNKNVKDFHKKRSMSHLIDTLFEVLCNYMVIIVYLLNIEWNSISLATIAEITATLAIVNTALGKASRLSIIFERFSDKMVILNREENDIKLILETYYEEEKKNCENKSIDSILIKPFSIKYLEESDNDKPFTLTSEKDICINYNDVMILYGPSGSGKSTFMKLLTERIRVDKSTEIPSTRRFLFYDEKLKFGSLSIYEELFCDTSNPDLEKMEKILKNFYLWDEIFANCLDVWTWMKEKKFDLSLSNGQKQRLILAKMLYWLDESIDVLVLDEATSGLDDSINDDSSDAQKILEYMVRYANEDKTRIIIISTHQNIDVFKNKIKDDFNVRNLYFKKENNLNVVREIN